MLLVEKHQGQSLMVMSVPNQQPSSHLFHIKDHSVRFHLLIDTGAEVSVIPLSQTEWNHKEDGFSLQAVNGNTIPTFDTCSLILDFGLHRTFCWTFVIAGNKNPILGADFFKTFTLLVDMKHKRLCDALAQLNVQGIIAQSLPSSTSIHCPVPTQTSNPSCRNS